MGNVNIKGTYPCFRQTNWGKNITKPYVLIFEVWDNKKWTRTVNEFDTLDDIMEEAKLINIYYQDTPKPTRVAKEEGYRRRYGKKEYNVIFENGAKYWGYIIINYDKNQIIRIAHDGLKDYKKIDLHMKDFYLREVDEVPVDYKFECYAEYEGWLQYRWGNGKNAVDYVEPKKDLTPKESHKLEIYDGCEEDYELDEDYEFEAIETTFADLLDKETKVRLMNRYGW